jgi:hypothetical protein
LTGTVEQLAASAGDVGDAWLRVKVAEPSRPGLADEVRELLGDGVVDVRVEREVPTGEPRRARRDGRTPSQLFGDYLGERGVADPRLQRAFDELHDELADSGAVDHAAADQAPATGEAPATDGGAVDQAHAGQAPADQAPATGEAPATDSGADQAPAEQLAMGL